MLVVRFPLAMSFRKPFLVLGSLLLTCSLFAQVQLEFRTLTRDAIEVRLQGFSDKNGQREATLKQLFLQSGCKADRLSEQSVRSKLPPNLICVLPGATDQIIIVGAHSDHVDKGDGVVDNWSGASLLPSLYYSLSEQPRRHTFVFVAFTDEEGGLVGSEFYARSLPADQRTKVSGMVNMDTLGLGPTEVWVSHSDKIMLEAMAQTAFDMKLAVTPMNVDDVGSTDSEPFAKYKIPRITIHSVTQETWPILHSTRDKLDAVKMNDYYDSYRLIAGYLTFLDSYLDPSAPPKTASQ
jgi:hypothetical protein